MTHRHALLLSLVVTSTGCASWFMNGGKLVDKGYSPTVKASYTVPSCKNLVDGSQIQGPPATYQLVQDGADLAMFERSADGSGAVINNRWRDAKGDHFFGWVQSSGWEYIVPTEPAGLPAVRVVYTGLQTKVEAGVTKPTSLPSATCEMNVAK